MSFKYNFYLELASVPLDIIICVFFFYRYKEETRVNREFRILALLVTWGTIEDIIDAIMLEVGPLVPVYIRYIENALNYALATLAGYQFVRYVLSYAGSKYRESTGAIINKILVVIYFLILLQNVISGNVYSYGMDGKMMTGPLYTMLVYAYPFYYILYGGVFILSHSESYSRKMKLSLFVTFIFMIMLYAYQMFFARNTLVTFFGASIGILVMMLTLETPDYAKLRRTLDELSVSRRELEMVGIRAEEASRAKSRFLAQMSNDIRTPVNAIMGYSNLILADTREESTREYSQRVKISAKRLLAFFESVLNYVSEEAEENGPRRLPSMSDLMDQISEEEDILPAIENDSANGVRDMRILVVDDTEFNVDLLVRMLQPMGFTVDTAGNGRQAIMQIRKFRYDLIFMDHFMPVMDGEAALKEIQSEKLCEDTPIVVLTANALEGDREKYLDMGFSDYLTKPFTEKTLTDILRHFLPEAEKKLSGEMDLSAWEALQEKLPTVRVADAREYLLHDIDLYKKLLEAYAKDNIVLGLPKAVRNEDFDTCMAIIRLERDNARLLGIESIARLTEKMEVLCKMGEYDHVRERVGALIDERKTVSAAFEEL